MRLRIALVLAGICCANLSCFQKYDLIREKFDELREKEEVTVCIFGNATAPVGWEYGRDTSYGVYMKPVIAGLLDAEISLINTTEHNDTYRSALKRLEEDMLSYRPDIVFIMMGLTEAGMAGFSLEAYREHAEDFFAALEKSGVFAIVLTSYGLGNYTPGMEYWYKHMEDFNEATIWEAGEHQFPYIDVFLPFEQIRMTDPARYIRMYRSATFLNPAGNRFLAEYVVREIYSALGKEPPDDEALLSGR